MRKPSAQAAIKIISASTRNPEVARTYRRIVAVPIALLGAWLSLLVIAAIVLGVTSAIGHTTIEAMTDGYDALALPLISILGIAIVVLARRRILEAADEAGGPTFPRPARSTWAANARGLGYLYALIGLAALWIATAVVWRIVDELLTLAGVQPVADFGYIVLFLLAVPLVIWAYLLGRHHQLTQLESATPPALRRAHQLRDQAQALEDAMHEATLMADDLQGVIDAEKRLISELLDESTEARRIAAIESDQLTALLARQERQ